MIDPEIDFVKAYGKQWPDVVDSAMFQAAAAAALNTLVLRQPAQLLDNDRAAAQHHRLEGAKQFLSTLMTLADPVRQPDTLSNQNLNHRL